MGRPSALRTLLWGEAPADKAERRLLFKIDLVILSYSCISFWVNYLDRGALGNAYVSGMKEDLGLRGHQLNIINTCLTIGYILGQVPHALAIQRVSPRVWFPSMVLLWGAITLITAAARSFAHLCVLRFFLGLVEASTYAGTQYVIGSWYRPAEIGKRTGLFAASGMAGTMFSGGMMTAINRTLDGKHGIPGWQWLWLILGAATLPVAFFGFALFPGLPQTTTAFWLTPAERRLAVSRLPRPPRRSEGHRLGWDLFRRVLLRPEFWVLSLFWVIGGALEAFSTQNCMLLWMKASGRFDRTRNTTYPLGITAVGIAATLLTAVLIDASGRHMPWGFLACGLQVVACALLVVGRLPDGAVFSAYYIAGTAYMIQPVCFTWANKILLRTGDEAARAVTLYAMNGASSVLFAFWGIVLYPVPDAGGLFRKGTIAMFVVAGVLAAWIVLVWWLERWVERQVPPEPPLPGVEVEVEVRGKESDISLTKA